MNIFLDFRERNLYWNYIPTPTYLKLRYLGRYPHFSAGKLCIIIWKYKIFSSWQLLNFLLVLYLYITQKCVLFTSSVSFRFFQITLINRQRLLKYVDVELNKDTFEIKETIKIRWMGLVFKTKNKVNKASNYLSAQFAKRAIAV